MNVPHSLILEQKENTKHGEVFFPIQKYITKLNLNSPVIMTHWHEEAELTLITKGSCIYQIDLVDYEVNEGDLLFIPPLLLHSIRLNGTDDFCSETYVFHVNFLGGNATDICSTRYLTPMINHELTLPYHISSTHPAHTNGRMIKTAAAHLPFCDAVWDRLRIAFVQAACGFEPTDSICAALRLRYPCIPCGRNAVYVRRIRTAGKRKALFSRLRARRTGPQHRRAFGSVCPDAVSAPATLRCGSRNAVSGRAGKTYLS